MRLAVLAAALLALAPTLAAQTADDFFPLGVGDTWVYARNADTYDLYRVALLDEVDGVTYALREHCVHLVFEDGTLATPSCTATQMRVTDEGEVVRLRTGGDFQVACGLGAPDGTEVPCDDVTGGGGATLRVHRSGPATVLVGDYEVETASVITLEPVGVEIDPLPAYAAGIGSLGGPSAGSRLEYARVGGAEYGVNPITPDPASFLPLAVGTVREYVRPYTTGGSGRPTREDDVRTLVLDGETWTLRRTQELAARRTETRRLLRFDAATATVLERGVDGTATPIWRAPCGFAWPVGESECEGSPVFKRIARTVEVGGQTRRAATLELLTLEPAFTFAAGLGLVYTQDGTLADTPLRYTDVGPLPTGDPLPLGEPFGDAFPTEIDPTPAHRYYPLSVGDEWHDEYGEIEQPQFFRQRRVTGTQEIDGEMFFIVSTATAEPGDTAWMPEGASAVRYDSLSGRVVRPDGSPVTRCPLDEPVNLDSASGPDIVLCARLEGAAGYAAFGGAPGDGGRAEKRFEYDGIADGVDPEIYREGVGWIPNRDGATSTVPYARLAYARVRQDDGSVLRLGTPLVVAGEDDAPTAAIDVTASPNPTSGALRLAVTVPSAGALTVEAFDALGRRVYLDTRDAVGALDLSLDASGWAPGVYVVRVRTADGVATARVVRR